MNSQGKKFGAHLYYMNDKNIRDAILSKRVKSEHLVNFLKDRGFLVSCEADKEFLVEFIGNLMLDYNDYMYLAAILENPDRKESVSSSSVNKQIKSAEALKAVRSVVKDLAESNVNIEVDQESENKIVLKTTHIDLDFSKTEMKQRTRKHGEIEIELNEDTTNIKFSSTEVGKDIKNRIISKLSEKDDEPIEPIEITLEYESYSTRTEFFVDLINGLEGYSLVDVVNVSVKNSDSGSEASRDEQSTVSGMIRKAVLAGKSLLFSQLYQDLSDQGFYIYKISWKVAASRDLSDTFTLEAQFGDANKFSEFKYLVKSVNRYSRGKLNISTSPLKKIEIDNLSSLIYKSALASYENIIVSKIGGEVCQEYNKVLVEND